MKNKISERLEAIKKKMDIIPRIMGEEAVKYFRDNVNRGVDLTGKAFKKRDPDLRPGGAVLQKRGKLRNSIRTERATKGRVLITAGGSAAPYAKLHNEGGEIEITPKMRKYFWAMHYKAKKQAEKRPDSKSKRQKALTKNAEFWMAMAMKTTPIKMPQREFIGYSPRLAAVLRSALVKAINTPTASV